MFVGSAELAAEVEDGVVVVKGEGAEEFLQLLEAVPDIRWVGFVGLGIGLVQLIQDGFAIAVTGVEGMGGYVGVEPLCNLVHISTPLRQ